MKGRILYRAHVYGQLQNARCVMREQWSRRCSASTQPINPRSSLNLQHIHRRISRKLSHRLHTWGPGPAITPTIVSTDPHSWYICVNTSICWTNYLLERNWRRQRYELIYICDLLWMSLFLIPNTPHNFQVRPRLTAFWENTSLGHKNVSVNHLAKPSSHILTAELRFNNICSYWQTRKKPAHMKEILVSE